MGFLFCLTLVRFEAPAQNTSADSFSVTTPKYRDDRILILPKPGVRPAELARFHAEHQVEVRGTFAGIGGLQVLMVPPGNSVPNLIENYIQSGLVEFAEPDHARQLAVEPNDPRYTDGTLWGLNNTGQNGGLGDADIDAPEGWDVLNSASNIVVAVIDTGIRRTHEDLTTNIWINSVDGGYGWNALTGTNNPADDEGHGSLVSGVLGAAGNNGKGVVGVAWRVQIMACKSFDAMRNGFDSDIIEGMEFARTNGARIINASLSGTAFSASLSNAVYAARATGIILVASAGNEAADVDGSPRYPACYDLDNIISVAATTRTDALWPSSNYGATNVDLAAPGHQITSTFAFSDAQYIGPLSGTSFAAPYVSGVCALLLAKYPLETHQQIIARLLAATDPVPALTGKCVTGGRLNLRKALSPPVQLTPLSVPAVGPFQLRVAGGANRTCVIEVSTNLTNWSAIFTNTTAAGGSFDFTDNQSSRAARRFFRATSTP
jgi:subtilisin family serine protease